MAHGSQIVPLKIEELGFLCEESVIVKRRFYSFAENQEERMESVVHEMNKYEHADKESFEHVLILIQTSKEHPLLMSELWGMSDILEGFSPKADIRWGLGTDENLGYRMFIMVVCSKR